ncbi:RNA polymerase III subunit Rpc25-domain-containing protein [Hypoxylon rubiginosum]|uniref:RNA polymerase III subunit Rpc25-domain-containing protein n=1 Tax=Hypoxylon rubiginosum TaxID=110542 RepID=A0ACC0D2U7_9PEZI|nr:RNA polymerase III subunit Rpc25-domain-containing protein [Hypoxylon rubiginosum]
MFILTKIADLVQITPENFGRASHLAIEDSINTKYSNKVIQKIGLCICMYDLLWASEGLIGHGDGVVNVNVEFRMIVFRPFKGETIFGKISDATQDGITIRTDFFEDIFVDYKELPEGAEYDHNQKVWKWITDPDDPTAPPFWYDKNETVRFQVVEEEWHDQTPESTEQEAVDRAKKLSPYKIKASMLKDGLGVCLWWA